MVTRTLGDAAGTRLRIGALTALLGGFGLQPTLAQDSDSVTVDVGACTRLESADARLACFGAQVDSVLEQRGRAEVEEPNAPIADVDVVDAVQPSRRDDERSSRPERRAERGAERSSSDDLQSADAVEDAGQPEYSGTIVALNERLPNAYVITLDNGQIWQQTEPKQYPLRPGIKVRIYPTRWGNHYRLNGWGSGAHIQVRRVQ
jgi:hypothetical protein